MKGTDKVWYPLIPDSSKLSSSTLIVPSVALGNVPQLAVDLLIHTKDFIKVGSLDSKYLYPFVAPTDYVSGGNDKGLSSSIEVYFSDSQNLTVIQQRSPIIPGLTDKFVEDIIIPFIDGLSFKELLLLDSSDIGLEPNLGSRHVKTYSSQDFLSSSMESLKITKDVEPLYEKPYRYSKYIEILADRQRFPQVKNLEVTVLVSFVYEGDNFEDGEVLASKVLETLSIVTDNIQWVRPISWQGAYGERAAPISLEEGLYG